MPPVAHMLTECGEGIAFFGGLLNLVRQETMSFSLAMGDTSRFICSE